MGIVLVGIMLVGIVPVGIAPVGIGTCTHGSAYLQQSAITGASAAEANRGKYCSAGTKTFSQWLWKLLVASAQEFLMQIGRRLTEVTTDPRETAFLFQRLSIAVNDSMRPGLPCRRVHNIRVRTGTFPNMFDSFLIFQPSGI